MSEVNVKEIKFVDGAAGVLVKKVKCDFKKLGPKFGKQMKAVAAAVAGMSQEAIAELEKNGKYTFVLDGAEAVIETTDVEIFSEDIPGWLVANEGKLTVALEVTVTEELRREGVVLKQHTARFVELVGLQKADDLGNIGVDRAALLAAGHLTAKAVVCFVHYVQRHVLLLHFAPILRVKNATMLYHAHFLSI
jgi:hypothetical protein